MTQGGGAGRVSDEDETESEVAWVRARDGGEVAEVQFKVIETSSPEAPTGLTKMSFGGRPMWFHTAFVDLFAHAHLPTYHSNHRPHDVNGTKRDLFFHAFSLLSIVAEAAWTENAFACTSY